MAAAYVLQITERQEKAAAIFDQILDLMQKADRLHDGSAGIDVAVHVMRGNTEAAIDTFRQSIDEGWRESWWLMTLPYFEGMMELPAWKSLMEELEADIDRQC